MKTQLLYPRKSSLGTLGTLMAFMIIALTFTSLQAQSKKTESSEVAQQERTIKGVITNEDGPLESVSVILKGTKIGTTTDAKGEFTFPKPLNAGDVLQVSYLGYKPQEVKIKENSDFVKIQLTEDLVEFVGALNTDTPYKSKRSKD